MRETELWAVLSSNDAGLVNADPITREICLREAYDISYDICNHDVHPSPLSLIIHHKEEAVGKRGALHSALERFARYRIGKYFNITLDKFLALPKDVCETMEDIAVGIAGKDAGRLEVEDLEEQLRE